MSSPAFIPQLWNPLGDGRVVTERGMADLIYPELWWKCQLAAVGPQQGIGQRVFDFAQGRPGERKEAAEWSGGAMRFPTTFNYLQFQKHPRFDITGDLTILCWIRPPQPAVETMYTLLSNRNSSDLLSPYQLWLEFRNASGGSVTHPVVRLVMGNGEASISALSNPIGLDHWIAVGAIVSGVSIQSYVNGQASGVSVAFTGTRQLPEFDMYFGVYPAPADNRFPYRGLAADIRLYSRALSDAEMLTYASERFSSYYCRLRPRIFAMAEAETPPRKIFQPSRIRGAT